MQPIIEKDKLLDLLPHGSGIDYTWEITYRKNGNIQAKNFFHAMNENGYYDGIMPFIVRIFRHKSDYWFRTLKGPLKGKIQVIHRKGDIDFFIICDDNRRASFYGLKDYLDDTISFSLDSIITKRSEII